MKRVSWNNSNGCKNRPLIDLPACSAARLGILHVVSEYAASITKKSTLVLCRDGVVVRHNDRHVIN